MKKQFIAGIAILILLAACQQEDFPSGGENDNVYKPIVLTKSESELASQGADFAFRLFRAVEKELLTDEHLSQEEKEKPLFISPLSASFALSMVSNGAAENTLQELTDVLGFSGFTLEEINGYHGKLMQELGSLDKESELDLANSLWVNQGFSVYDTFKQLLARSYGAETRQQDLTTSLEDINAWCSEKTNGRIPKLLEQVPKGIKLLLLNTLYFKSKWEMPFDKNDTREDAFANEDGTSSRTAFMHRESSGLYGRNDLFALAGLPYGNRAFSLQVLLPHEGVTLARCMESLNGTSWAALQEGMRPATLDVALPKLDVDFSSDLIPALKAMGVEEAFSDRADFGKLSASGVKIGMVHQSVSFHMNEEGAEAAAGTAADLEDIALPSGETIEFHVRRPFLVLLTEKSTGCVLFMGKVNKL